MSVFKTNDPLFNIGSCVVLHNGSKEESDDAIRKIILPNSMLISKVPVYVGWVPTRNIYSVLQGMESKMQSLQSDVQGMESKIDAKLQGMESKMDGKLQSLQSDVQDIKITLARLATLLVK